MNNEEIHENFSGLNRDQRFNQVTSKHLQLQVVFLHKTTTKRHPGRIHPSGHPRRAYEVFYSPRPGSTWSSGNRDSLHRESLIWFNFEWIVTSSGKTLRWPIENGDVFLIEALQEATVARWLKTISCIIVKRTKTMWLYSAPVQN